MESPELSPALLMREFVMHIDRQIADLRTEMRQGFQQIDTRFDQVDRRFEQVDRRFDRLDERLLVHDRALLTNTRLAWMTAGVALVVSLIALWR